jgi:hypothetical protein
MVVGKAGGDAYCRDPGRHKEVSAQGQPSRRVRVCWNSRNRPKVRLLCSHKCLLEWSGERPCGLGLLQGAGVENPEDAVSRCRPG